MRALMDLVMTLRATGAACELSIHDPCPELAAIAQRIAETVPGAWHPNRDGTGWVSAVIRLGHDAAVTVTMFGVRRPADWTDPGPLGRWYATSAAGRMIEELALAEEHAPVIAAVERLPEYVPHVGWEERVLEQLELGGEAG